MYFPAIDRILGTPIPDLFPKIRIHRSMSLTVDFNIFWMKISGRNSVRIESESYTKMWRMPFNLLVRIIQLICCIYHFYRTAEEFASAKNALHSSIFYAIVCLLTLHHFLLHHESVVWFVDEEQSPTFFLAMWIDSHSI